MRNASNANGISSAGVPWRGFRLPAFLLDAWAAIASRSMSVTRKLARASWYAVAQPTTPPPTMTTCLGLVYIFTPQIRFSLHLTSLVGIAFKRADRRIHLAEAPSHFQLLRLR